jgi:hypothetical protein
LAALRAQHVPSMTKQRSPLDADLNLTHERFVAAMEERMGQMSPETKERYSP